MRPWHLNVFRLVFAQLVFAGVCAWAGTANAGCTWKFDWYCLDCAKIGGRTTGEQGGYSSRAACESARSSVHSGVTTTSCDSEGWCDTPSSGSSSRGGGTRGSGGGGGGIQSLYPSQTVDPEFQRRMAAEIRAQEEARTSAEAERKARQRAAFENAKSDLLGQLKGKTLDQDSGLKGAGGGETLKLKSGTATFGIKGNPGGELRLKEPAAVKLKNPETARVDPGFFTRPKPRLRIRSVPNPKEAPKGTWLRYVKSDRAGLILDALETGKGDLDIAIAYLDGQIIRHGSHNKASSALSYLEGLRTSYAAAGAEYRKQAKSAGQPSTVDSKALLNAVLEASGVRKWPGDKNPDAQPNKNDWRVQRTTMMLQALEESPGDLEAAYDRLQAETDVATAENAEHYLRGVYAYWDFLGREIGK